MKKSELQVIVDIIHATRAALVEFINEPTTLPEDVASFKKDVACIDAFFAEAKRLGLKTE